jgi:SAM-dependent methyltransferase
VPFYRELARRHGDPVLELGCGTGRVTLALAREGTAMVGVDLAPAMLELARQKAAHEELGVTLALGDLRSFDLGQPFPLVLLPYNTLNHLVELDSLRRALECVRRHMDARSRFVIDTFQPSLAFLGDVTRKRPFLRYRDPYTDQEILLHEENHYDPSSQQNRIVWSYEVDGETVRIEELTMRIFFPAELEALLVLSGFAIEARYGDYDQRPFGPTTPKQLTVCRLA